VSKSIHVKRCGLAVLLVGATSAAFIAPATLSPSPAHAATAVSVVVDPSIKFQTINGFGASMVDQVPGDGGLPYNLDSLGSAQQTQVMDLLFSPTAGAGLSMLRVELGAGQTYPNGSTPVNNFTIEPTAPASPSATPTYVWDGNASGEVAIAKEARELGVSTIYADAWSAPAFMKTTGSVVGGTLCGMGSCASGDWQQAYANYLAQYVKSYASSGVTIDYVSAFNEPGANVGYQSMSATPAQVASFDATLGATFSADGVTAKIASADVSGVGQLASFQDAVQGNSAAAAAQSVASFHSYSGTPAADPSALLAGKPSWQTEFTCVGDTWNTAYSSGDCDGEYWADTMYTAMNNGVGAYMGWTGAWSHSDNEDLIRITGPSSYQVSSRLYVMGNYSRYVRPGATRIEAASSNSSVLTTAYRNTDGSYVVVASNTSASDATLALSGLTGGTVTPVVTDDSSQLAVQPAAAVSTTGVSVDAPAHSTVTYVFSGSAAAAAPTYEITNVNSGKPLSVDSTDLSDGGSTWVWTNYNVPAQQWNLIPLSDSYYEITNVLSGEALSVDDSSTTAGATVFQWHWSNAPAQEWKLLSTTGGALMLENKNSGQILSVANSGTADGSLTNQWSWVNSTAELWTLSPTS
jgi:glucosylceramidase